MMIFLKDWTHKYKTNISYPANQISEPVRRMLFYHSVKSHFPKPNSPLDNTHTSCYDLFANIDINIFANKNKC